MNVEQLYQQRLSRYITAMRNERLTRFGQQEFTKAKLRQDRIIQCIESLTAASVISL